MSFALVHQSKNKTADTNISTSPKRSPHRHDHINNLPINSSDSNVHLQRTIGNQSVERPIRFYTGFDFAKIGIHPKLKVSQPGDVYEQEADIVREQMMRTSSSEPLTTVTTTDEDEKVNRKCKSCKDEIEEEKMVYRKTDDANEYQIPKDILKSIDNMGREGGLPIDVSTRTFMESRFGFDFSRIKVHTDTQSAVSAQARNALAYTVGNDIVFATNQYQPYTLKGRALLAHELAHTIQQKAITSSKAVGEDTSLEDEANKATVGVAMNRPVKVSPAPAAPAIQFLRVSSGGFGKALEAFTDGFSGIHAGIITKTILDLKNSKSFMELVKILDQNYLYLNDKTILEVPSEDWGPNDRIQKGKYKGKRRLLIASGKSHFDSANSPTNGSSADIIYIDSPDPPNEFDLIGAIAHEATHAARSVGKSPPPATTLIDEVKAGIQDEIKARESESKILGEIPASTSEQESKKQERIRMVGSLVPAEVERDIIPAFNLTYLELFAFGRLLRKTQLDEKLTLDRAEKIREEIQRNFGSYKPLSVFDINTKIDILSKSRLLNSKYAEVWFNYLSAQRDWEEFNKNHKPTDDDFTWEREKLLQIHNQVYFYPLLDYRPVSPTVRIKR
jgi:hypothetical protein